MLSMELLWVILASLIVRASCANDFNTSDFPSEFALNKKTEFYWKDLKGYIAGIRVHARGEDEDSDSHWILEPNCSDDDDDSSCTAYSNNGSAYFGGSYAVYSNGTKATVGSGYELRLLWTDSESYDDIDDDTSESSSPSFSIVRGSSETDDTGGSKGQKAGIAVAVVVVIMVLLVLLWWWFRRQRRRRRMKKRKAERERDAEKADGDGRWTPGANGLRKSEGTWSSWDAAALPAKPSPTAGKGRRSGSDGQLYLDNKAELPADVSNQHKFGFRGFRAASNKMEPRRAASAPMVPVELPAEPMREHDPAWRPRTEATRFVYNPRPSYALRTSTSPRADCGPVSPVSPAATGPVDGSVSPISPISRKPVRGSVEAAPVKQWQGSASDIRIVVTDTAHDARDGARL